MAKLTFSTKRLQISKANAQVMGVIAGASFMVIFSLIATRALISQHGYQSRVIAEKEKAKVQLQENIQATQSLTAAYQQFVSAPENILGGNPTGRGERDGDNAKLILDALPSKYDFPALTASLEKMLSDRTYKIEAITGSDDEVNQQGNASSPNPVATEIPFQITVNGSYPAMQNLIGVLEKSIRPIQVQTLEFSGTDSIIKLTVEAKTFYQPEKNLEITTKVVQ